MKKLMFASAFALAVLLAGLGAASLWLGRGVKAAVEAFAPEILGAPVKVGMVTLAPWSGRGAVRGVVIGNPAGFKGEKAASLGSIEIAVRLSSLASDLIVVERVAASKPELVYEVGAGGSNIARLHKNAEAAAARLGAAGGGKAAAGAGPSKSLLIKEFSVEGGEVAMTASALGGGGLRLPLPAVRLTNLGGKGRTPAQVASQAWGAVSGAASRAVSGAGSKALEGATGAAADALKSVGGLFKKK